MILNPSFLRHTRKAAADVRKAEDNLAEARRDFETAVRRLYVEGASVREIGEALSLSHQRIHQLIGAKQTSWWQRLTGQVGAPARGCSFCGKRAKSVSKLVAGPSVHICDGCINEALTVLGGDSAKRRKNSGFVQLAPEAKQRCSFCGKRTRDISRATASGHQICATCAMTAKKIIS